MFSAELGLNRMYDSVFRASCVKQDPTVPISAISMPVRKMLLRLAPSAPDRYETCSHSLYAVGISPKTTSIDDAWILFIWSHSAYHTRRCGDVPERPMGNIAVVT